MQNDSFIVIEYAFSNYFGENLLPVTKLEFRLQNDPKVGSPFQIIHIQTIDALMTGLEEQTYSIKFKPDSEKSYLVICFQNKDTSVRPMVGIDNIEI